MAGSGWVVATNVAAASCRRVVPPREQPFAPNAFVAIDERVVVTLWLTKTELGQGAEGAAVPSNFHDQPLLRLPEMPRVDVNLVIREVPPEKLGGVGEIGVPPVAPAVANAVFAATGKRVRVLPMQLE